MSDDAMSEGMKRGTTMLTGELEAELEADRAGQEVPPTPPRARDLPALLAGLPRLSEDDAGAMARDLDRARDELDESGLRDP